MRNRTPENLTIALLAIVCMLIACFPTAALILIKKYIWVRIWIANPSGYIAVTGAVNTEEIALIQ